VDNLVEQLRKENRFDIESPFNIEIDSVTYRFQCLIRGYGAEKGMVIDEDYKKLEPVQSALIEMGYGFSCFDILKDTSPVKDFINDVLNNDWGKNAL
jgi:hypothetical protein